MVIGLTALIFQMIFNGTVGRVISSKNSPAPANTSALGA